MKYTKEDVVLLPIRQLSTTDQHDTNINNYRSHKVVKNFHLLLSTENKLIKTRIPVYSISPLFVNISLSFSFDFIISFLWNILCGRTWNCLRCYKENLFNVICCNISKYYTWTGCSPENKLYTPRYNPEGTRYCHMENYWVTCKMVISHATN